MATRLFLRAATTGLPSGTLPSAEQSSRTSANDFEANQATNRRMTRTRGTSETSLANASTATVSATDYYVARWQSDPVNQTSIAANTWTYYFGASVSDAINGVFPTRTAQSDIYINIYVWKPSNGTKVGTIVDAVVTTNTNGGASASESAFQCGFT